MQLHENSMETLAREFYEETGIKVEPERLVFLQERLLTASGIRRHEIAFYYAIKDQDDIKRIKDGQATDLGRKETLHWIPISRLHEIDLVPAFMKKKLATPLPAFEHIIVDET